MLPLLTRRFVQSLLLIFGVLVLVFLMVRLTGDPAALMMSRESSQADLEAFRERYGLNLPIWEQFANYITGIPRGDLGNSLRMRGVANMDIIMQRLPPTLELATASLLFALAIAIPMGVLGGMYPNTWIDAITRFLGLVGQTIPNFWLAMILIIIFSVNLRMFPSFGRDGFNSLILPMFALGLAGMGQLTRLMRSVVLEIRNEHYVRTARAKGIRPFWVAFRHILPNAAIPLVSVIGIQFTYLLGGSVYIETIFSWPGLGSLLNDAIQDSDFPLVQAITIFIAFFAISINFLTDIAYALLDPRIRHQ